MERVDPAVVKMAYLMVVKRGEHERFDLLSSAFGDRPVEVVWDRRVSDRRRPGGGPSVDRRIADRRHSAPANWNNLGFLIAGRRPDPADR